MLELFDEFELVVDPQLSTNTSRGHLSEAVLPSVDIKDEGNHING